ncbi:MAG TPA: hypothetical protein PLE78_08370 [Flavobacteriales bacterium]|nr:hypothetical protein [Flavobacteriales bacterium]HQW42263.1 hypothetical protein [Flavobacteriales bacterium]
MMSNHKGSLTIALLATTGFTCGQATIDKVLQGLIVLDKYQSTEICIYQDSIHPYACFSEKGNDNLHYGGFTWLYTSKTLMGQALYNSGGHYSDVRCDLMEFDSLGEPKRVLYKAIGGELAWTEFSSWDDKFVLFTTHHLPDPSVQPFEGLMPMLALKVLDMTSGAVVHIIDSIGRPPSYQMNESPWLHDGHRFVWSIRHTTRLIDDDGDLFQHGSGRNGIHMFDMRAGTVTLLVEGAKMAVVSPIKDILAYIKENKLCVFDMESSTETILFTFGESEQIRTVHWSPDGSAIFVGSAKSHSIKERLIDVQTGKELPFTSIGMTNGTYSWK